ncbi:MAG: T9SS type A sorting domain-containing protein [Candidatus Marinimicrobia bacterium]|nr:T9SS type A sorting domain-containing protein [Candidatus Neomarinimicrobiota bacterium]
MKIIQKELLVLLTVVCAAFPQKITKVSAGTSHFYIDHAPTMAEYALSFDVRGDSISNVSVEGPNISTTYLELEQTFTGNVWRWHKDVELAVKPLPGDAYVFHITFNDSSRKDTSDAITGTIDEFPTIIYPHHESTINTTIPIFTWTQLIMEVGGMDLIVVDLTLGEEQNVWYSGLTQMDTSVIYNYDSSGVALEPGKTYGWVLVYRDVDENNSATLFSTFSIELTTSTENLHIHENLLILFNSPNPFNSTTRINYDLPEHSEVNLTIYDVTGREVVRLQNQEKPAGHHEVQWNGVDDSGNQVSTGIYLARLQALAYSKTIKMVFLK